jgi:hypothetical protein
MGSLYGWSSRKDLIRHLITTEVDGSGREFKTLAHTVRGATLWAVQQWTGSEPFIACYLLKGPVRPSDDPYACGYKDMDESMHPYYYNCPVKYLDMTPEKCPEWREKVRAEAARKGTKLKVGWVATLHSSVKAIRITNLRPLRGQSVDEKGAINCYTNYKVPRGLLTGEVFKSVPEYVASKSEAA